MYTNDGNRHTDAFHVLRRLAFGLHDSCVDDIALEFIVWPSSCMIAFLWLPESLRTLSRSSSTTATLIVEKVGFSNHESFADNVLI